VAEGLCSERRSQHRQRPAQRGGQRLFAGADRRYALAELTATGRTLCHELDAIARAANDQLLTGFSDGEITQLKTPASLRGRRHQADRLAADGGLVLRLPVAPDYNWDTAKSFLAARAIPGVEVLDGDTYRRTITVAGSPGLLEISPGDTAGPAGGVCCCVLTFPTGRA